MGGDVPAGAGMELTALWLVPVFFAINWLILRHFEKQGVFLRA